ncbi:acetate kinase [Robbsia sp. KACC 23696]|uniref:acetate/propionate family kinase n=1 Tax=Robbsia sp. KACC 23696 TaxID=3149231 RepID=UPI00325B54ED
MQDAAVLTVNSGSSSLKLAWFRIGGAQPVPLCKADMKGIGSDAGTLTITLFTDQARANGAESKPEAQSRNETQGRWPDQPSAFDAALQAVEKAAAGQRWATRPDAIAHRIVHGGPDITKHGPIDDRTRKLLEEAMPFAPLHLPIELALIDATRTRFPGVPHFACLDTVFHNGLPAVAKRFPLPEALCQNGLHRYGFHGLSYEHTVATLGESIPARTVIAHLGSGASLAALQDAKPMDTTMGLGPTGGIPMSSRSGDLDPTILLYLMREHDYDADKLETLLDRQSGLKGLSGLSSDVQVIQEAADKGDATAAFALTYFVTAVAKAVGSFAAILGGVDLLVFTGGVGEHSAALRERIADKLGFLSLETRVVASDENKQMAAHVQSLLG